MFTMLNLSEFLFPPLPFSWMIIEYILDVPLYFKQLKFGPCLSVFLCLKLATGKWIILTEDTAV